MREAPVQSVAGSMRYPGTIPSRLRSVEHADFMPAKHLYDRCMTLIFNDFGDMVNLNWEGETFYSTTARLPLFRGGLCDRSML